MSGIGFLPVPRPSRSRSAHDGRSEWWRLVARARRDVLHRVHHHRDELRLPRLRLQLEAGKHRAARRLAGDVAGSNMVEGERDRVIAALRAAAEVRHLRAHLLVDLGDRVLEEILHPAMGSGSRSRTTAPVKVEPVVPVSSTVRYWPTRASSPGRSTVLKSRVRACTSSAPRRAVFSTSTSWRDPSSVMFRAREAERTVSMSRASRSDATSSGTVSLSGIRVAGVPSRGENLKVKASSKASSRTALSVSSKSASLSPGNPTMTSVVNASPGIAARSRATQSKYPSRV